MKKLIKLVKELNYLNETDGGSGAVFPKDHPLHDPNSPGIEDPTSQSIVVNGKEVDRSSIVIDGVTTAWGPDDGTSDAYPEEAFFVDGTELSQEELEELEENYRDEIYELAIEQYFQGEGVTQDEGSCGFGINGKVGNKPAGPHLIRKSNLNEKIRKLIRIEIKSLKEAAGPVPIDNKKFYYIEDRKSNEVLHRGPLTAKSAAAEMEQYRNDNSVVAVANRYNKSLWLPGYAKGPREKNTEYPDSPNKLSV